MKVVEEELDETLHWLEFIGTMGFFPGQRLQPLMKECDELLAIMVKSIITAKKNTQVKKQLPNP